MNFFYFEDPMSRR